MPEKNTACSGAALVPRHILRQRLANHHLATPSLADPAQLVMQLGAVQAQDYPAAKWALAQRLTNASDAVLEDAFAAGTILRTHVLRPTWHFVAPADIRWMLALTAPRIKTGVASYTRGLGIDPSLLGRCARAIEAALQGGNSLTRAEVGAALRQAGIDVQDGAIIGHIVLWAELEGVVCSGPRRGRQHTYALLDERVSPAPALSSDEALVELTWRYFSSHGPAVARDCSWWSGLPVGQVNRGLELNRWRLNHETAEGRTYWFRSASPPPAPDKAYLLPNYDEYTVAYRERDLYFDRVLNWTGDPRLDVPFCNVIVVGGRVVGRWKPTRANGATSVEARWSIEPSEDELCLVATAAERYTAFVRP